jgi:hypothetical protein
MVSFVVQASRILPQVSVSTYCTFRRFECGAIGVRFDIFENMQSLENHGDIALERSCTYMMWWLKLKRYLCAFFFSSFVTFIRFFFPLFPYVCRVGKEKNNINFWKMGRQVVCGGLCPAGWKLVVADPLLERPVIWELQKSPTVVGFVRSKLAQLFSDSFFSSPRFKCYGWRLFQCCEGGFWGWVSAMWRGWSSEFDAGVSCSKTFQSAFEVHV